MGCFSVHQVHAIYPDFNRANWHQWQKYGYIVAGEQTAIVTGLSDEVELSKKENAQVEANILASSIKAPEEWYTPILDAVFGVE